jgi:NADPH2:quinone reductase
MKAYVYGANGAAITDIAKPEPKGSQVLVKVHTCGMNRADLGMIAGHAHGAAGGVGTVLGMEFAGEIAALGPDARGLKVGDRVMGSGGGAYAEYAVTDYGRVLPIPASVDYETAATLTLALTTMHNAVVTVGGLQPGQSVLVQGASAGVGLMAMQIAKLKGAKLVVGSSTDATRRARLKEYGADLAIDSSDPKWVDEVLKATDGKGVDLIIDQVSGKTANQNLAATRVLGRIVNVGRLGGMKGEFNYDLHALKRIDYIGVTFRTRSPEEVRAIVKAARADLWPAIESGKLHLPIDRTFPLSQAAEALAHMKANAHFGKIVLVV